MKKIILGLCAFIMGSVETQARVAFVDPAGNLIEPQSAGITAAEADMVAKPVEVLAGGPAFYETPLVMGIVIFAVLLAGFVLFLKRRK